MSENVPNKNDREIKPVAQGKVTSGRRSIFRTIYDEVIVKNYHEIKDNFVTEIVIPNTLDWLNEVCSSLIYSMFKSPDGAYRSTLPDRYKHSGSYTSYSKSYQNGNKRSGYNRNYESGQVLTYKDISFDSRREAEKVLTDLRSDIREYGTVTISDLCSYAGVDQTWADVKYGWANLDKASAFRAKDGRYYLNLPEPRPIEEDE